MPTFEVCVTSTLEIYATIEAEDAEQADTLAYNIQTIDYANETVGAETRSLSARRACCTVLPSIFMFRIASRYSSARGVSSLCTVISFVLSPGIRCKVGRVGRNDNK